MTAHTAEKVLEILKLSGVAPRDYDVTRPNLEQLDEKELDEKLLALKAREKTFSEWRKTRGSPFGKSQEFKRSDHGSRADLGELQRKLEEARDFLSKELEEAASFKKELQEIRQAIYCLTQDEPKDLLRSRFRVLSTLIQKTRDSVIEQFRLGRPQSPDVLAEVVRARIIPTLEASNKVASFLAESLLDQVGSLQKHPILPSEFPLLTWAATIEAMARAENVISKHKPDLIVAGAEEGYSIARALAHNLELSNVPIITFRGHDADLSWDDDNLGSIGRPNVILVLGRLGFSGKTFSRITRELREKYRTQKVYCVVLAATREAVAAFAPLGRLVYHQLTIATSRKLREHNPVVEVNIRPEGYRVSSRQEEFPTILFEELKSTRRAMEKIFPPVDLPPWDPIF